MSLFFSECSVAAGYAKNDSRPLCLLLFWLTLVVALAVGWWLDHKRLTADEFGVTIDNGPVHFDRKLMPDLQGTDPDPKSTL